MVTSNLPFGRWGETFSDDLVAAAMIDRLVHHAEILTLTGDSCRTRARRDLLAKDNRTAQPEMKEHSISGPKPSLLNEPYRT